MPASSKMLKNKAQKANREAGIGDEKGRMPSRVKTEEVQGVCAKCFTAIRMTKTNTEAQMHTENKHPGVPFAECFPGKFDPTSAAAPAAATAADAPAAGGKIDVDQVRAAAREARAIAEGGTPKDQKKPKKKKEDLSFLDAALK
jgi:hypothetical protein